MRVRMGIHTGETVAGSIGSDRRLQYTTLGETANLAARLEGLEKEAFRSDPVGADCRILVSEATRRHIEGADPSWELRPAGTVVLHGASRSLAVFELRGASSDAAGGAAPEMRDTHSGHDRSGEPGDGRGVG
jgi:adenylate cyclase